MTTHTKGPEPLHIRAPGLAIALTAGHAGSSHGTIPGIAGATTLSGDAFVCTVTNEHTVSA